MAGMIQSSLLVFDGKNYDDWCVKMDVILGFQEVDEIVKRGFKEPSKGGTDEAKKVYKENEKLDCKARMLLHQCVSATIFQKVSRATTTKEAWDILQDGYGNSGRVKKVRLQSLQRQYELLSMGEQETIEEYIGRIQVVVNAMQACDKVVKDRKIIDKILQTLTPQYNHIVVAIEESKDLGIMKIEELQNSLEAHEQRLVESRVAEKNAIQSTNQALQARSSQIYKSRGTGRGKGRLRGGRNGGRFANTFELTKDDINNEQKEGNYRGRGKYRGRGGRKNVDKRNVQCFTCNKYGHYSSECWHIENAKKEKSDEANLAKEELESDFDHVLLMSVAIHDRNDDSWRIAQERHVQETSGVTDECLRKTDRTGHVSLAGETSHEDEKRCGI
ncbi:uncharacterized protein LOC124830091 [Vigna umbellata]|uniref:uncharacterized protein LOC124830089 n=1 Tax=Vigna umbellata TaxID=87088 RepID=UPI001F5FAB6C|nr:uncharacterized protein LOC124830089 [Vigna umbellata]XP_047159681.1 uncharacterized protein LOC124830091 [Vigna umbellata]